MDDVWHLIDDGKDEPAAREKGSDATRFYNMRANGATEEEANYLLDRRVELNAFTSDEFVAFIERKLTAHGIRKIVPSKPVLNETYRTMVRGRSVERIIKRELRKLEEVKVIVPGDLPEQVHRYLVEHPVQRWDAAVTAIVKAKVG